MKLESNSYQKIHRRILRPETQNKVSMHEDVFYKKEPNYVPGVDIMGRGFNFVKGVSSIPLFQWKRNVSYYVFY